jgi:serine/threonine protein kinase
MTAPRHSSQAVPAHPGGHASDPSRDGPASSATRRDPLAGTQYRAVRRLGAGGMGEVFEALHVGLNKPVVVKLLHEAIAGNPHHADRLRVEAQTLASVESPHLVSVTDIGCTPEGRPFFVMERLHGATFRKVLDARGALPPEEAIPWIIQVLTGLGAAHQFGIIHRDVKLDNLFLCDPAPKRGPLVKVLDFGVAKVLQSAGLPFPGPKYATEEGHLVGSPRYVSPEQVRFEDVDARTDVYAVGVVLYTLLVGHGPFPKATDVLELLNAHLLEAPPPPSRNAPQHIAYELDSVVLKAMAKRPEHRFQSAESFADELRRVADLLADTAQPLPLREGTPRREPEPSAEDAPTPIARSRPSAQEAKPITSLPVNLVEPSPGTPTQVAPPASPGRSTLAAVTLGSAVFFSALFVTVLRLLGVL